MKKLSSSMTNNKTKIVEYIYSMEETSIIEHTLTSLVLTFESTKMAAVEFAARFGLIQNTQCCDICGEDLRLSKKTKTATGIIWTCKKICGNTSSVLKRSILEGSHLKVDCLIKLLHMWSEDYSQIKICKELKINKNTCVSWCLKIREMVEASIESDGNLLGGMNDDGSRKEVEIDESLFFRRKYNRGRIGNQVWVFAAIERNSGKCFFIPVKNRTAGTLLDIIYARILPGTRIISDQWAAYNSLSSNTNYTYASVNHSLNFVSPTDPSVHTQNVESLWSQVKRKLKYQYSTTEDMLEGYFFEFIWRKRMRIQGNNSFGYLLGTMKVESFFN